MGRTSDSNTNNAANSPLLSGIYEAIVVSHLDRQYMGTLEVDILRGSSSGALPERSGTTIEARYLMPFYGTTHRDAVTPNDGYSATQKTYGMWMVPPDVGTRVLVVYVEGISRCYWIGCIPDQYMNFMVPDGRASTTLTTEATPENLRDKKLPVGEYNKKASGDRDLNDPTRVRKPYNKDFTQVLEVQGLLDDENRGTTSSSARREVPSMVFGVNTPGPVDKRVGAPKSEQGIHGAKANFFSNRLGGSSFVMDDGDDKFLRKTTADAGPPEYVNKENGDPGGDPTLPHNELIRLRTRTGHQILMHNTEDLIYIGNGRGTTWIEMTSDGKIDIYANDSISVHTDQDLNFTADRDVNIEAGRNINMNANARWSEAGEDEDVSSGNINVESKYNTNWRVGKDLKTHVEGLRDSYTKLDSKITVDGNRDDLTLGYHYNYTHGDINLLTDASYKLHATKGTVDLKSKDNLNLQSSSKSINSYAAEKVSLKAGTNIDLVAATQVAADASKIWWNSEKSADAAQANEPAEAVESAKVDPQPVFILPKVTPGTISGSSVVSIVKRMPTHEPWTHHENLNPLEFKPEKTDIQITTEYPLPSSVIFTTDTFTKNRIRTGEVSAQRRPANPSTGSNASGAQSVTGQGSQSGDPAEIPEYAGPVTVPDDLIEYIKSKEGFHAVAFWDYRQWTNGYGTRARRAYERITEEEAVRRLRIDVQKRRDYVVDWAVRNGRNWSDDQINAMTSFIYNGGYGWLPQVTANGSRTDEEVKDSILAYDKAGGERLAGLTQRRREESAWFAQGLA